MVYIFDLKQTSKEVYSYLSYYFFTHDHHLLIDKESFIEDLEQVFLDEIKQYIEHESHPILQLSSYYFSPYKHLCDTYQLNYERLTNTIYKLNSYKNLFTVIKNAIKPNTFDLWIIERKGPIYILRNLGDFRILEWERDHIKDGKYVP